MMFICLSVGTMMSQVEGQGYLVLQTADGQLVLKDSDIDRMTFDINDNINNQNFQHTWYVIGGDVADGTWNFDLIQGRIPMYIENEDNGIVTFTGYFAGKGFKVVGESWDDQWGIMYGGNFGDFWKDTASDIITVPSPGFYTVRLDNINDYLTITPVDITAPSYTTVSMSGTFNEWQDTDMQRVPGSNSHDWYCAITFDEDVEMKFKADNSWNVNWGRDIFPSGQGVQDGANIPVKAGTYIVFFNELTGYYHFYNPNNPVPDKYVVPTFDLPIEFDETYVDFETYESPTVQLFRNVHIPLEVDYAVSYQTVIGGISYDGLKEQISTSELESIVQNKYGLASMERELTVTVIADVMVNGFPEQYSASTTITCKLPKPTMPEYLYFIGATDGWSSSSQRLASPDFNGIYTGFCYVADPNGWGLEYKLKPNADNWDNDLNSDSFSQFLGDAKGTGGGNNNLSVSAGEGVYYMEVDMNNATFKAVKVNQMSIIGAFSNWSEDVDMTWDATTYSYKATGVGATAVGWKFRVNHDWTINLGGTLNNLSNYGDNLYVNANTIELFPTRRDSNNIYCTAE